jgi:hypothetical protein
VGLGCSEVLGGHGYTDGNGGYSYNDGMVGHGYTDGKLDISVQMESGDMAILI